MCSPTRASVLTGRNHHAVGMGFLADMPTAYPGLHVPAAEVGDRRCPRVLRDAGYNTTGDRQVASRAERANARTRARSTGGRSATGSSASTASSRATRTNGRRTSSATTTTSSRPAVPKPAITSPKTSPTRRSGTCSTSSSRRPASRSICRSRRARCTRRTTSLPSGSTPYRGRFDAGWERWRAETFARQIAIGHRARGHRAHRTPELGPGVGRPVATTNGACTHACRRCSRVSSRIPTRRSGGSSTGCARSACSTTRS